jgi:FemAB-related protein (PEP-CTERM system-associated)
MVTGAALRDLSRFPDVPGGRAEDCDPLSDARWPDALRRQRTAHLAHAPEWAEVIAAAYGHAPRYLRLTEAHGTSALLPAFLVRRPLGGAVLTSMPFLDGGGPCAAADASRGALVEHLIATARAEGAGALEIRTNQPLPVALPLQTHKVNMILPLPPEPEALWQSLSPKVRNQVRKAERSGLVVVEGGAELLDDFYTVFAENMRDLGSPVHSRAFFSHMLSAFDAAARILVVRKDSDTLGGLVALNFKQTMHVPWASCLRRHAALCPNMLLYWSILERSSRAGFRWFDFGRSTRGNGTHQFKRQWGAQEHSLYWYTLRLDGRSDGNGSDEGRLARHAVRLWQRLPVAVSRVLGPRIRRYLIQ